MRKSECLSILLRVVTIAVAIIVLFSKPSLAADKSTSIEKSNLSVSTPYGPLILNLSIKEDSLRRIPALTGDVTNGTDRAWRIVSFKIVLLDKKGNELPTDITEGTAQTQELKKNGTSALTDLGSPITFYGVPWKKVSDLRVQFDGKYSYYDSTYVLALVKPPSSHDLTYEDELIKMQFGGSVPIPVEKYKGVFS
jgi:hypothetical protein